MMSDRRQRYFRQFDDRGAVAAMYALSLFALVGIAGIAFDYARLAGMDSELQNGADQAALAGATQLDKDSGACARATNAAIGLLSNPTLLANDGGGLTVKINGGSTIAVADDACSGTAGITFYKDKDKTTVATTDADAYFIEVAVDDRVAKYAFTPVVGAFFGDIDAKALAGLGSSVCNVPPVFMCNPAEATDPDFTVGNYVGKGVRLIANDGGSGYGPGNFGYLESNAGNGAIDVAKTLGRVAIPGDCVPTDGVTTKAGQQVSVLDSLNTRFDIYANGINNSCGTDKSMCPPSTNSRKDVMLNTNANGCKNGCAFKSSTGKGWDLPPNPYLPSSAITPLTATEYASLSPMGYPRDMCHAVSQTGSCTDGQIGDGNWDRAAYFGTNTANYASVPTSAEMMAMFGSATPTRYQVYQTEAANAATMLKSQTQGGMKAYGQPAPDASDGVAVGGSSPDRRVLSVAVVDCQAEGVQGKSTDVHVTRWVDIFLVEPSLPRARTSSSDVYVEIIDETSLAGGASSASQSIRRDVPYLVQ